MKTLGGFSRMRFGEDIDFSIRIFQGRVRMQALSRSMGVS